MKRSIGTVVAVLIFWFATYAVVQMAVTRVVCGEQTRRMTALVDQAELEVAKMRWDHEQRARRQFYVTPGDTIHIREGEIVNNPSVVGKPKLVSK